jgi:hypothetical protein
MSASRLFVVAICWALLPAFSHARQVEGDSVLLVNAPDVSGSMVRAVQAMAASEIEQLRRTLKPGDAYARIEFAADARLTMMHEVRAAADVEDILAVLGQKIEARGNTSISSGLMTAREAVERAGTARRVVLVIATDGVNDPTDGAAAERQRLDLVTEWWRNRQNTDRILVGIGRKRQALDSLASQLGARLVSLDEYATTPIVERAIVMAREQAAASRPAPTLPPPSPPAAWRAPVIALAAGLLALAGISMLLLKGRGKATRQLPRVEPPTVIAPHPPAEELVVTVTANGRAQQTVLPVNDIEHGILTLGGAGAVDVPGLFGAPLTVMVGTDGMEVAEEPGTGVLLNGQPLGLMPLPARVGRACRLAFKGVAMNLQLRLAGEGAGTPALRVVAQGRRQ